MHSTIMTTDTINRYIDNGADGYIGKSSGEFKKLPERIIHKYASIKNLN